MMADTLLIAAGIFLLAAEAAACRDDLGWSFREIAYTIIGWLMIGLALMQLGNAFLATVASR